MEYRKLEDMCRDVANIIRLGEDDLSVIYDSKKCEVHFDFGKDGHGGAQIGADQKMRLTFSEKTESLYDLLLCIYAAMCLRQGLLIAKGMDSDLSQIRLLVLKRCIDVIFENNRIFARELEALSVKEKWAESEMKRYHDFIGGMIGIK